MTPSDRKRHENGLPPDVLAEEVPHQVGYLVAVLLQRKVSGVEQVKIQILQISLIGLSAGRGEDLIVLPPDDEHRRLVLAEIGVPFRVERRVAAVAIEQRQLDLGVPRPVEERLVDVPVVGADRLLVPDAVGVLPDGGLPGEKAAQGLSRSAVFSCQ